MDFFHNIKKMLIVSVLLILTFSVYSEDNFATNQSAPYLGFQLPSISSDDIHADQLYQQFHQVLVAEFYHQSGDVEEALKLYVPLALDSSDPDLVKHVTEIAIGSAYLKQGLKVARHWVGLSPKSLEGRQYFTLLLLRLNHLKKSAKQLAAIRELVEEDKASDLKLKPATLSKGLKFIGALLIVESHHDKAYQVYKYYLNSLEEEAYIEQKNLILASLAMKAKSFEDVVEILSSVEETGTTYFSNVAILKTEALKKLGRKKEAAQLLSHIIKTEKNSDSLRIELIRLLVTIGKKSQAEEQLTHLISKHADNYDLLKSLIALNIDLKNWEAAAKNNKKLLLNADYAHDANYFYGEIYQAQGDLEKALKSYQQVEQGSLLKKSNRKVALLLSELKGLKVTQAWLHREQIKYSKKTDRVHWLKIEADLLARLVREGMISVTNLDNSLRIYDEMIALTPRKISYRYYRGLVHEQAKHVLKAEQDFKAVIKSRRKDANALNALGYLLIKHTTRLKEAERYIKQAYKIKPRNPKIMDSLGWLYYKKGDIEMAEKYLRQAFSVLKSPEVASHLITVLSLSNQKREAREIFNVMIKKHPDNISLTDIKGNLEHI